MKVRVILLIGSLIIIAAGAISWFAISIPRNARQEVLLTRGLTLGTSWVELRPSTTLRTVGDWSELLIEVSDVDIGKGHALFVGGSQLQIEACVTSSTGEEVQLSGVQEVEFGAQKFVRLSDPSLEWKKRDFQFATVRLRASLSIHVGRVIWISYDPRASKDGVAFPATSQ